MPKLTPVNYDPFAVKLTPVDYDPFEQKPKFSVKDLPLLGGGTGFSDAFSDETGLGFWDAAKPALADVFGNYEDVANAIAKKVPGAKLVKDADGYEALELPNGKRFAMNLPGVQGHEVAAALGKGGAFVSAATIGGWAPTLARKLVATGVASAVTDAGLQKLAVGRDNIDKKSVALSGALGAAGELAAPLIGGIGRIGKEAMTSNAKWLAAGRELANDIGLPENIGDDVLAQLGRRAQEFKAGAKPEAVAAESEFGLKLTKGQKTGDYGALRREEMLRSSDSVGGRMMRDADEQNLSRFNEALDGFRGTASVPDAIERVSAGVRGQYQAAKSAVDEAYGAAKNTSANIGFDAVKELPGRLASAVRDYGIDPQLHPATYRTLQNFKQKIAELPEGTSAVTLKAIETQRRVLNNAIGAAANKADRAALNRVKATFDDWLDDSVETALVSGDKTAIDAIKNARGLRQALGQRFESHGGSDAAGKLIQKMINGGATTEDLAQSLLGAAQVSKVATSNFVGKVKGALGNDKEALKQLKSAVVMKATTNKGGETVGPQAVVSNLKQLLVNRPTLMKELYSAEELNKMGRIVQAGETLFSKGMLGKSSGTAERMYAFMEQMSSGMPFGEYLMKAIRAPKNAATAANAYARLAPKRLDEAVAIMPTDNYRRRAERGR